MPSPQGNGSIKGYLARPANAGKKLPGVLVVHENRGLNPYIEDVARRLAVENYLAFAPDGLDLRRRLSGRRRAGRGEVPRGQRSEDAGGLRRRGEVAGIQSGVHRKNRRRRLLFRRRCREHARRAAAGTRRSRALLRPPAERRGCREDQGSDSGELRRQRSGRRRRASRRSNRR